MSKCCDVVISAAAAAADDDDDTLTSHCQLLQVVAQAEVAMLSLNNTAEVIAADWTDVSEMSVMWAIDVNVQHIVCIVSLRYGRV